jgi:hypothetical protein
MESELSLTTLQTKLNEKYFVSDWVTRYITGTSTVDARPLLLNSLNQAAVMILDYFTLFLLTGLYCKINQEDWEGSSRAFKVYLESKSLELDQLLSSHGDLTYEAQDYFLSNIITPYEELINPSLTYLLKDLDDQLDFQREYTRFRIGKQIDYQYDGNIVQYSLILQQAFLITDIEHFKYNFSESLLRQLLMYPKALDDLSIDNSNTRALKCKISFLMKKLTYTMESQKTKEQLKYSYDHNEERVLSPQTTKLPASLDQWDKIIKVHNGSDTDSKDEQRKRFRIIQDAGGVRNYGDFLALMKIYKDDSRSVEQVKNLRNDFKGFDHQSEFKFNRFAKIVTGSYLFNNEISLKIESLDLNSVNLSESFKIYIDEIRNYQVQAASFKNYFPWEKLCKVLAQILDELSDDLLNEKKFILFESLNKIFAISMGKLEDAFRWSKRKSILPFQLCFNDCQSDYEIQNPDFGDFKLFFFSSYVLPIDFSSERKMIALLQQKTYKFETLSTTYKKLKIVVEEVNETSDRLRNSERRSIEILAVFSAISLFSIGSIQLLTNPSVGADPSLFYKIVISFGYCLILFVVVIWIITRNNIKDIHWVHWVLMITILMSGFVIGSIVKNDVLKSQQLEHKPVEDKKRPN